MRVTPVRRRNFLYANYRAYITEVELPIYLCDFITKNETTEKGYSPPVYQEDLIPK